MQHLFSEFKRVSAAEWKNQLIKDLKGESYDSLVWKNENGFDITPFYTPEDLHSSYEPAFTHAGWEICVNAQSRDAKELNRELLRSLSAGASAIAVDCSDLDLETALKDVQLNYIQSAFFVDEQSAQALKAYLEKHYQLSELHCSLFFNQMNSAHDLAAWKRTASLFGEHKGIKTMSVNALPFHNQNCLAYYEVAIILSALTEYLEVYKDHLPAADLVVKTGVSADYFVQIAKLRAIHRLWNLFKEEYKIKNDLHLIVETGLTNKSISDSYNNLLRTTIEAMAAVAGGCNELIVTGFDVLFEQHTPLAERMAINQQLILKDESYLDKMADVACGSYYIESITDAIASKALDAFKSFEAQGGYFACIEKQVFHKDIEQQAKQRAELFNTQKQIAIGVNKFRNDKEKIQLSEAGVEALRQMHINNPVLNFELDNYFQHA